MIYDIGNVVIDYSLPVTYPKRIDFKHGYFGPEYQFNDLEHKAALIFTAILNYEASNGNCNICDVVEKSKYINLIRSILKRNGIEAIFVDEDVDDLENAPYAEYKVFVSENGNYTLQSQFNPTSNLVYGKVRLRYGIKIDKEDIDIINTLDKDYLAGSPKQGKWGIEIENNSRISVKQNITLNKGVHTIRYYQCDPNIALIRMVLYKGKLANVYGSPEESPFIE